jgi:hypothetical protein
MSLIVNFILIKVYVYIAGKSHDQRFDRRSIMDHSPMHVRHLTKGRGATELNHG